MKRLETRYSQAVLLFALMVGQAWSADPILKALPKDAIPVPMDLLNFDRDAPGQPPPSFTFAVTGVGPEVHWEIKSDHSAPSAPNVLVQSGKGEPGENYALAILDGHRLEHGEVAVRFKIVSGEDDQAAGLLWRYQDPQTYYVVSASAHDDACTVYRVKKGKTKLLDTKLAIVSPYTWHELRIVFVNKEYTAFLDEEMVLGGKDSSFLGAGQVGLWTKSDSSVQFDDFRVTR